MDLTVAWCTFLAVNALLKQIKSKYIYHFPIDLEATEITFDAKSIGKSKFGSINQDPDFISQCVITLLLTLKR